MGVRIFVGHEQGESVTTERAFLYDSTTGRTIGEVFDEETEADDFLVWAEKNGITDVRRLTEDELTDARRLFRKDTNYQEV